jgi:ADP-ribose pyrophosphatase YjhB (NUDIX family)
MKIDLVIEHPLQRKVFERLLYESTLHFSELREKNVESNLLTYHLSKMCKAGLIKKVPRQGYSMTTKGRALADRISLKSMQFRLQPKISTMIVVRVRGTQTILMYRRQHQPFLGQIGFPSGKVHIGENMYESVGRELKEKAGLEVPLAHQGDAYITLRHDDELLTHFLGHIFYAEVSKELPLSSHAEKQGEIFWGDVAALKNESFISGFHDILSLVDKSEGHFFTELEYQV